MTVMVGIKEKPLMRDMRSKAVLSTDTRERDNYLARKAMMKTIADQTGEINRLREDVDKLLKMMTEGVKCR